MIARLQRHAAALCLASAMVLSIMLALEFFYFRGLSGGLVSLDIRVGGFSPEKGMAWLMALGPSGAEVILVWHYLTFDLVFPALLAATFASLLLATGNRLPRFAALSDRARSAFLAVLILPYMVADYAQNFAVARMLSDPLRATPASLSLASALIVTKFALVAVPGIVIAVFWLAGLRARKDEESSRP